MPLGVEELELVWERLAVAIDRAGPRRELMLAKLALLLFEELGDAERAVGLIESAGEDLS